MKSATLGLINGQITLETMCILCWKSDTIIDGLNFSSKPEHFSFNILNNNSYVFDDLLGSIENGNEMLCPLLTQYIVKICKKNFT
jgi:hypothetical protein